MGIVYLISDGELYKIGVTKSDIEKRIKKLQTGNGKEIYLVAKHKTEYPYYVEKTLHFRHCNEYELGEWFDLKDKSIFDFEKECEKIEEMIETMKDNPWFLKKLK